MLDDPDTNFCPAPDLYTMLYILALDLSLHYHDHYLLEENISLEIEVSDNRPIFTQAYKHKQVKKPDFNFRQINA